MEDIEKIKQKYPLAGRPVAFKTPEDLLAKLYEFLAECENRVVEVATKSGVEEIISPAPRTIEAFCAYAGITKTCFYDYGKKPKFKNIIAQYKQIVEAYWVSQCAEGRPGNKADFILKNAFADNWKDDKSVTLNGQLKTVAVKFIENDNDKQKEPGDNDADGGSLQAVTDAPKED